MILNPYDLPFNAGALKPQTVERVKKLARITDMHFSVNLDVPVYFILRNEETKDLQEFKLPYTDGGSIIVDLRDTSKAKYTDVKDAVNGGYERNLYPAVALAERIKYKASVHKDKVYMTLPMLMANSLSNILSLDIVEKRRVHMITMLFMASNYDDIDENIALLVKKYSLGAYATVDFTEIDTLVSELSFDGTIDSYLTALGTVSDSKRISELDAVMLRKAISSTVNRSDVVHVYSSLFIPELLLGVLSLYNDSPYLRRTGLHQLLKNNKRYILVNDINIDINKMLGW